MIASNPRSSTDGGYDGRSDTAASVDVVCISHEEGDDEQEAVDLPTFRLLPAEISTGKVFKNGRARPWRDEYG